MKRVVIRHLSSARAKQTDTLELERVREIVLGRDPSADIRFDPNRDDLVSRLHAKIVRLRSDSPVFSITDLTSQNGTYVNREIVRGTVELNPGDVIRLGRNSPEFRFDIEPRPPRLVRTTRVFSALEDDEKRGP